jgi:chromosomal replication initiator protein
LNVFKGKGLIYLKVNPLISMDRDQIWQAVLGEIELNISRANFTTWFKNTFISFFDEEQVVICVPNAFTKAWLEKKYHTEIQKALESVANTEINEIIYKVETKKPSNNTPAETKKVEDIKVKETTDNSTPQKITSLSSDSNISSPSKFGLNPKYTFNTFVVGKGNELANAACNAVAANPGKAYNPLFIYGGVGLGKTHLLQAIGNELAKKTNKILYLTSEKFTNNYVQAVHSGNAKAFKDYYRNVDLLLVDDVQFMGGKDGTQQEFFHTFNELQQADKQIVLTSDKPPKSIPALEKRLLSRFEAGMVADISQPDIETKIAILENKAKEKKFTLDKEILEYIANNVKNNIRELEGALNRVVAFHEFNNTPPTINSVKSILTDLLTNTQSRSITPKDILMAVAKFYDISSKDLTGKGRKKELVWPRQVTIFLMREEINTSYPTIGYELGGRDHTTAMHAYNKVVNEMKNENERIKQEIESIKQLLTNDVENPC